MAVPLTGLARLVSYNQLLKNIFFLLILHLLNGVYLKERVRWIRREVKISKQNLKREHESQRVEYISSENYNDNFKWKNIILIS